MLQTLTNNKPCVVVVDDDRTTCFLLRNLLSKAGFDAVTATDLAGLRLACRGPKPVQAVLLDLFLAEKNVLDEVPALLSEFPDASFLVLSGQGTIDLAVTALRLGAVSFLTKPIEPDKLLGELRAYVDCSPGAVPNPARGTGLLEREGLIGRSEAMKQLGVLLPKIARAEAHVLVLGESGTGKELVARAIHRLSPRRDQRFEAINCAAIPDSLFESLLFGHAPGSFTGAKSEQRGLFEVCSGGTLFLDEIGEMPLPQQSKLLRVLQEREIRPLGRTRAVPVNTRVVAATNRNLRHDVAQGRFRADLFYRLSVVDVELPPLRERRDDIPELARYFLGRLEQADPPFAPLSAQVLARLCEAPWPGNVRELKHCLERAAVLAENGRITLEDLGWPLQEPALPSRSSFSALTPEKSNHELDNLKRVLKDAHGNVAKAARYCGKARSDMYRLFKKYGIDLREFRVN